VQVTVTTTKEFDAEGRLVHRTETTEKIWLEEDPDNASSEDDGIADALEFRKS
jgi:hypothetical protein